MHGHQRESGSAVEAAPDPVIDLPPPDADAHPAILGPPPYESDEFESLRESAPPDHVPLDRMAVLAALACFAAGFAAVVALVA